MALKWKIIFWVLAVLFTAGITEYSYRFKNKFYQEIYSGKEIVPAVPITAVKCSRQHYDKVLLQRILDYTCSPSKGNKKISLALIDINSERIKKLTKNLLKYLDEIEQYKKYKKLIIKLQNTKIKSVCRNCAYQIEPANFRFVKRESLVWLKTPLGGNYYMNGSTLQIMEPVLSDNKKMAIVYISTYQGPLAAQGEIAVFELLQGKWQAHRLIRWIS